MSIPKAIAINTRLLIPGKTEGIGRFSIEILKRWVKLWPSCTFYFLFDRKVNEDFLFESNVIPVVLPPMARHPILYYIWFHIRVKNWLKKNGNIPYFSPEGYLPLGYKGKMYHVIHDLNFEDNDQFLPRAERYFYKTYFPQYAKASDHIFTVSEFSKSCIANTYNIAESKISVSYNAVNLPDLKMEASNSNPYILYVGSLHPRKNLKTLVAAFSELKQLKENQKLELHIAGMSMWNDEEWLKKTDISSIKLLGRVSDQELASLYKNASVFCYPSLYEGFGLPIIEAQSFDCPVVCSNNTSLPEISGDSTLLFDAENATELSEKLTSVLHTETVKNELISKGRNNIKRFDWQISAEHIAQTIAQDYART
jgi:glycosyltransferase involved in cell wall biosynthesis